MEIRPIIKKKKGALTDLFLFMIIAFVMSLVVGIFIFIANTTEEKLLEQAPSIQKALGPNHNATEIIQDTFGKVPSTYNNLKWITTMLIVGMILSILITSFLINVKPVFFIPYILVYVIAIIVAVPLANSYEEVYSNPTLASSYTGFFGQTYIMLNLHIWVTIIGGLAGIVMFIVMVRKSAYGGYE